MDFPTSSYHNKNIPSSRPFGDGRDTSRARQQPFINGLQGARAAGPKNGPPRTAAIPQDKEPGFNENEPSLMNPLGLNPPGMVSRFPLKFEIKKGAPQPPAKDNQGPAQSLSQRPPAPAPYEARIGNFNFGGASRGKDVVPSRAATKLPYEALTVEEQFLGLGNSAGNDANNLPASGSPSPRRSTSDDVVGSKDDLFD
jgi:hypothetical protein